MYKVLSLAVAMLLLNIGMSAQAAVQVIHNSPTPGTDAGPVVDIYVNGELLPPLTAVPFRVATPQLPVPAGVDIEVAVAVSPSGSVDDAIATFPLGQLTDGENYTVIANGIVGDEDTPFDLAVTTGQTTAMNPGEVDVRVFHGSPDAPAVDVDARGVANELVDDLSFGNFTGYLNLPASDYLLDVRANDDPNIVASFSAPLSGLAGGATTVIASGLLGETPAFGLFAILADGTVIELPAASEAAVQVIHNSPTPGTDAGPVVDIYVNGGLLPELTAVPFRAATAYLPVPGDVDVEVAVAVSPSSSVNDAIATFPLGQLTNGENYTVIANGIVGDTDAPFNLEVSTSQQAAGNVDEVDVRVFHGSPDAPAVDVDARGVADELVDDLSFGNFTGYLNLPPNDYLLDVRANDDPNIVASFTAPLSGLTGGAATVIASGLLGETPAFGLFAILPDGTVIELPATSQAGVQVIHNSPTPDTDAGPVVDIYVNGALLPELTAVPFRAATAYLPVAGDVDIEVAVAVSPSSSVDDAIATFPLGQLVNGQNYTVIATGIVGNMDTPFDLAVSASRARADDPSNVDLLLYHGSPDAPEIDVILTDDGTVLFDNVSYGNFGEDYLSVPAGVYGLSITPADDNETIVVSYDADLSGLAGQSATVFASGLLTEDATPAFDTWVALADGTTLPLSAVTSTNELADQVESFTTFPNPANDYTNVSLSLRESANVNIRLIDQQGRVLQQYNYGQLPAGNLQERLELGNRPAGQYYLQLQLEGGQLTQPFIIK